MAGAFLIEKQRKSAYTEIANIMHISKSTVNYIKQAHTACVEQDWNTLQRLSSASRPLADWAMRITGVDKKFLETFGNPVTNEPVTGPTVDNEPTTENISKEDFAYLKQSLSDICKLLVEIRDILK